MLERYNYKIGTAEEIASRIAERPVILCHGVFDIVHPGHIRHLLYAKSKAKTLVCSVTADRFVHKGIGRPHVPEQLRAMNLAALECVDFVIIDNHEEPGVTIERLKPEYFAKGFEYETGLSAATQREIESLKRHGGEILFTPGDVVYSSTALLRTTTPSLRLAKLQAAMEQFGVTFADLRQAMVKMREAEVHVVGDVIVDIQQTCGMLAGQPKTPTIGAVFQREDKFVGGAGIVAKHLCAAGAGVQLTTVLGDDAEAEFVLDDLMQFGVDCESIVDRTRPTTQKRVYTVDGYRALKIDTVDNRPISDTTRKVIEEYIKSYQGISAIIFSDFRHGIFNERTVGHLVSASPPGVFRAADSQVASRWGNICDFQHCDLITPNEREARFALGDQDSGIRPLASRLYDSAHCKTLIMKLGDRGVLTCCSGDHNSLDSFIVLDSHADSVVDPVGAGDALLAYATLVLAGDGNACAATILGNFAAAAKCGKPGNLPVSANEVISMIDAAEEAIG